MSDEKTVVQGEASESDEEPTAEPSKQVASTGTTSIPSRERPSSIVVLGEASESDDDEALTPLRVEGNPPGGQAATEEAATDNAMQSDKPKYDTLLHWKLKERNAELRKNLCATVSQVYVSSTKELRSIDQQLHKSHQAVQDISHNMRLITNDLFHLEDKLDIIRDCDLLPVININLQSCAEAAAPPSPPTTTPATVTSS